MANDRKTAVKPIQSVERALEILSQFTSVEKEFTLSELSKRTGLKRTTCYGLAETLVKNRYLHFNEINGTYMLGVATFRLGQVYSQSIDLRVIAGPFLKQLSDRFNSIVHLAIPDGDNAVYIDKVGESDSFRVHSRVGRLAVPYCSAISKIMLAEKSDDELRKTIKQPMARYTPNTITSLDELIVNIHMVRMEGIALDDEEAELGLACMAAPIYNKSHNCIGIVSMSGSAAFMHENFESIKLELKKTSKSISSYLGE